MIMILRRTVLLGATALAAGWTAAAAAYPAAAQMQDLRKTAEQLAGRAAELKAAIQKHMPGDRDLSNRSDKFTHACHHLVNITNVAIGKGEHGRHTQRAYGDVMRAWTDLNAAPGASGMAKWKLRAQVQKLTEDLAALYR